MQPLQILFHASRHYIYTEIKTLMFALRRRTNSDNFQSLQASGASESPTFEGNLQCMFGKSTKNKVIQRQKYLFELWRFF